MTTHELARKLLEGPDLLVTVRGYEGGVDEIKTIDEPALLCLNDVKGEYFGAHTYPYAGRCSKTDHEHVQAIHLSD